MKCECEGPNHYGSCPVAQELLRSDLPVEQQARAGCGLTFQEIILVIDHARAAGIRSFVYRDLQFSFEGTKQGNASEALRNPALRNLLGGTPP